MKPDGFAKASTLTVLHTPAAVAANGNTAGVDIRDMKGEAAVILSTANTAGTDPTLAVKLQHSVEADLIGTIAYAGTGNGTITQVEGGADAVAEDITVTFSNATTAAVVGSVTGAMGSATVGTEFASPQVRFMLTAGSTAFVNTDAFTIPVSARTYADVGSGAFTGVTSGGSIQRLGIDTDRLGRYLRANFVIGGTVSPAYRVGLAALALQS